MSSDPAYLRDQAAKCRRLAKAVLDKESVARLTDLADSYDRQAAELEPATGPSDAVGTPMPGPQPA